MAVIFIPYLRSAASLAAKLLSRGGTGFIPPWYALPKYIALLLHNYPGYFGFLLALPLLALVGWAGARRKAGRDTKLGLALAGFLSIFLLGSAVNNPPKLWWVDVQAVGCKGDGTTDDTACQQAAWNALGTNGGTIIYPYGTYLTTSKVSLAAYKGVRLLGAGPAVGRSNDTSNSATVIKCSGANLICWELGTPGQGTYVGPEISGFRFWDPNGTAAAALHLLNISYAQISNVSFTGFTAALPATPSAPTVTAVAGGSLGATVTVYAQVVLTNGVHIGYSNASAESSATTSGTCPGSGNCSIQITSPASQSGQIGWLPCASTTSGQETCQASAPVAFGTNYTITSAPSTTGLYLNLTSGNMVRFNTAGGTGLKITGTSCEVFPGSGDNQTGYSNQNTFTNLTPVGNMVGINNVSCNAHMVFISGNWTPMNSGSAGAAFYSAGGEEVMGVHTEGSVGGGGYTGTQMYVTGVSGEWNNVLLEGGNPGIGINCQRCSRKLMHVTASGFAAGQGVIFDNASGSDNNVAFVQDGGAGSGQVTDNGFADTIFNPDGSYQKFGRPVWIEQQDSPFTHYVQLQPENGFTTNPTQLFPQASGTFSLAAVASCGTAAGACANTVQKLPIFRYGQAPLTSGSPSTATITSLPFSSATSFSCWANDTAAVQALEITYSSGSQIIITGPNSVTHVVSYGCVGT